MTNPLMGHNGPPTEGNWIAVSRDIRDHHYVGFGNQAKRGDDKKRRCFSRAEAWLDMLMEAQYRPVRRDIIGATIWIDVGQFLGSRSYLAKRWNWSEQSVRTFLKRLADEGMIQLGQPDNQQNNQQSTSNRRASANVITICNYLRYQQLGNEIAAYVDNLKSTSKETDTPTSNQPATNQQSTSQQPESNKETKEQVSTPPSADTAGLPEIDGLNGNTAAFCEALAKAENPFAPDYEMAHKLIQSNVNHYGGEIVSVGFLQWQAALADRSSKAMKNAFRSLPNYIEQVRKSRESAKPQRLKDKGFSTFSDLIEKSGDL